MADQATTISVGTQVVSRVEVRGTNNSLVHPRGAVGLLLAPTGDFAQGRRNRIPWRKELHPDFGRTRAKTKVAERPDYKAANRFLVKARRRVSNGTCPCC
jgi:hypothetical protein